MGAYIQKAEIKGLASSAQTARSGIPTSAPYTSINDGCTIEGTEVEDSVIMEGCTISRAGRIVESLIGKNVVIRENGRRPAGHRFIAGDSSEILL